MNNNFDIDLLDHLEYGKLYLFASSEILPQATEEVLATFVSNSSISKKLMEIKKVPTEPHKMRGNSLIIAARRFNAGNVGRYAALACCITDMGSVSDGVVTFFHNFLSIEEDSEGDSAVITTITPTEGAAVWKLRPKPYLKEEVFCQKIPEDHSCHRPKKAQLNTAAHKGFFGMVAKLFEKNPDAIYAATAEDTEAELVEPEYTTEEKEEDARIEIIRQNSEEDEYANSLQLQRNRDLRLIQSLIFEFIQKYHADPSELISNSLQGKYIVNTSPMLVVNHDRKIILPEYNEMELKMSAASRTLYIWFLTHPQGSRLKDLTKHRTEIIGIYEEVHPGCNYVEQCVDALLQPDRLNQNFSRIKKIVRSVILNDDIAASYFISKDAEGNYRLPIAAVPEKIRIPKHND